MNPTNEKKGRSWLTIFFGTLLALVIISVCTGYYLYKQVYGDNLSLSKDAILTIPANCSLKQLSDILEQQKIVNSGSSFLLTVQYIMTYNLKSGKYKISKTTKSNRQLIRILQGHQLEIKLTFHNFRVKEQLAAYVGSKIAADSAEILDLLENANYLEQFGYTPETVMAVFIPETYYVYWNCTVKDFWLRMLKENGKFWNDTRKEKAKALELSQTEIYTLASIVECESQYKPERPRIAGVYINRLKKQGWKLEADPTVVFAVGDFSLTRVLNKHLELNSPYNTYIYPGLPPGPIYMSSISSIDAVLNYEKHNYMFFCAKPHEKGQANTHAFAKTHKAHIRNAKIYWRWLRRQ